MHDKLWDDRHVEARRTRHTLSMRVVESGTCSQRPPRNEGFEQQRKAPEDEKRYLM